jgi:hypothetical protein
VNGKVFESGVTEAGRSIAVVVTKIGAVTDTCNIGHEALQVLHTALVRCGPEGSSID